ncbi:hypothetical protein ACFPRL_08170 [Pseudoclavibacter helvolus]
MLALRWAEPEAALHWRPVSLVSLVEPALVGPACSWPSGVRSWVQGAVRSPRAAWPFA